MKDRIKEAGAQANQGDADGLQARLMERLAPLLAQLDQTLTKRLVRAIGAIVSFRHSGSGLLLSELGAFITSPAQAPAGTKRLSNLLRSEKWQHGLFERFLWEQGDERVQAPKEAGEEALVI